ncbi:hypothetical protein FA95DRAFT_1608567 [Auriscalpium vulgare]|uniref:Uncharacterized protein n=1 Tax=Auriscalpium vulgare TaxID=40419 RepID=A0ACB8RK35_9AGAM|nr:hypothetical protein FA95DRAFT_1608567 [Auriscalpium vulgare]
MSPPLKGDANGIYRVHLVGNSGACAMRATRKIVYLFAAQGPARRSTLGAELAAILDVPFISLDTLYWKPNWQTSTADELQANLERALAESPRGWVVDGNYVHLVGDVLERAQTDVIWLAPPLALYLPRLCVRTFLRLVRARPPCSPGCEERAREVFSRDSIVWLCVSQHWRKRRRYGQQMGVQGVQVGGTMRRLGGWGAEQRAWVQSVRDMVRAA